MNSSLPVIWRSNSEEYEKARIGRVFNHRRPERSPLAVVAPTCTSHIIDTVLLAIQRKCRISVRSGGHSWAAWSVRDDAILIDLGNFREISLDEKTGIVKASPSTTGRMLNSFLAEKGCMFAGGHCPDVGLGGFLLQGGMGWNCKNWGWACQSIAAIDAVTADGSFIHCSADQNSELFWAARGAGPGFPGVVTRFYLQSRPSFSHMRSSAYSYPKSDYCKAMDWVLSITADFDSDTEIVAVSSYPPGHDEIHITVLFVTFKNSEEAALKALQRAEDSHPTGTVGHWFCKSTSLEQEYNDQARANPEGHRYTADNAYICNDANVLEILEEAFTTLPSRKAFALWYSMAPVSRRPLENMALSMQSDHYFALYTVWEHKEDDERCQNWVKNIMRGVDIHSEGAYLGDSDFQVRRTRFWGEKEGIRLHDIRRKWDPLGTICGYLDAGDISGVNGLENVHEWVAKVKI